MVFNGLNATICPKTPLIAKHNREKRHNWCCEKFNDFPLKNVVFFGRNNDGVKTSKVCSCSLT